MKISIWGTVLASIGLTVGIMLGKCLAERLVYGKAVDPVEAIKVTLDEANFDDLIKEVED